MKQLITVTFILLAISCSMPQIHDGTYTAKVFNSNMTWMHQEVLQVSGSNVNYKSISIGGKPLNEFSTTCTQFEDRIEIVGKDGLKMVCRIDENGNLKYGEYTYKKVDPSEITKLSEKEEKPLVEKTKDGKAIIHLK